ncbi:MAG: AMP-binding protein [Gammaproteobacteria bacterium]|nr:AMP-binding protein [Gammaproteobacteria bacterium]
MDKVWLKNYPPGIPVDVDVNEYSSLLDLFERSVQRFSDAPAYANMGRQLSYADLDLLSRHFAAFLQQSLELQQGERIAIMLPNLLQYPVVMFGAFMAGLTIVNTNPLYTSRELKHQLRDSGADAIVVLENYAHVVAEVIDETDVKHVIVTGVGDLLGFPKSALINLVVKYIKRIVPAYSLPDAIPLTKALARGRGLTLSKPRVDCDDIAFLQYTGGTTGMAKGAMLTHGNMVANVQQASAWFQPLLIEGKETIITALPLYHIFSLLANCLVFLKLGGQNYLITNPRDMKGFVRELSRVRFTCITGVNTLFNGLLNSPGFSDLDFSELKMVLGGGMAVQAVVANRWMEVTGVPLIEAYGLTETSPAACINPVDTVEYNGSIGLPLSSTACSIQDDDGHHLPFGEVGELCIRGPQVMKGYWNSPEETKKVLSEQGWFRTGDVATMDDEGYVNIVDRKKDMIIVSGFNVYPNEIESVIAEYPGVVEVGVFGVADKKTGEAVKAVIVKKGPNLTESNLRQFCKKNLTAYKCPKYIEFSLELPKSNVGKILRRQLREQFPNPDIS